MRARTRAPGRDGGAALAARVRELADRRAVEDALTAYAHALDTRDYARLRECLARDVRARYAGSPWLEGVEQVAEFCARSLDSLDTTQHRLSCIDVKLERGRGNSVSYLCAEHVKDGRRFTVGGRYLDRWIRTRAGWRIAQRELEILWTDGDPRVLGRP